MNRNTIKRQIAASRRLIALLYTRSLQPANAATDTEQIRDAFERLSRTTSDLAREFYQRDSEAHDGIRQ